MKTKIITILVILITIFLVACSTTNDVSKTQSVNVDSSNSKSDSSNSANNAVEIIIKDFKFTPNVITIKSGTKVKWINQDSVAHTIKSDSFNSDRLGDNGIFEFTFSKSGSYDYICGLHTGMKGRIIVE